MGNNPRNSRIHRNTFPRPRSLDSMSCLSRTQMVGRPRVAKNSSPDHSTHHIVESLTTALVYVHHRFKLMSSVNENLKQILPCLIYCDSKAYLCLLFCNNGNCSSR